MAGGREGRGEGREGVREWGGSGVGVREGVIEDGRRREGEIGQKRRREGGSRSKGRIEYRTIASKNSPRCFFRYSRSDKALVRR